MDLKVQKLWMPLNPFFREKYTHTHTYEGGKKKLKINVLSF